MADQYIKKWSIIIKGDGEMLEWQGMKQIKVWVGGGGCWGCTIFLISQGAMKTVLSYSTSNMCSNTIVQPHNGKIFYNPHPPQIKKKQTAVHPRMYEFKFELKTFFRTCEGGWGL